MQVSRWGNSLAVRLPAALVQALDLKEGDDVQINVARGPADGQHSFSVRPGMTREEALAKLKQLSRPLPPDFRFSRQEANERGGE